MRLKGFSTNTFLTSFDRLQRAGDAVPGQKRWTADGLNWSRDRHAFYSGDYSVTLDIVRVSSAGAKGWTLMMVREGWWVEDGNDPIKTRQWAHLIKGDRIKALADFSRLFDAL